MYDAYDYCEEPTPADSGWVHEDDLPDLDHAKNMLVSVRNALYETGDVENLEDCLEELLACFDLKIPLTAPVLEKKESVRTIGALDAWLQFNHEYNEHLLKTATC